MSQDSSSSIQMSIQEICLGKIKNELENCTEKEFIFVEKYPTKDKINCEFDFYSTDETIFGEIYAGIGTLKAGSKKKVLTDCFKLIYIEEVLRKKFNKKELKIRKVIVLVCKKVEAQFKGDSWAADAIEAFGIELIRIELTPSQIEELKEAKRLQALPH